jgi:hypothetical protein
MVVEDSLPFAGPLTGADAIAAAGPGVGLGQNG